MPPIKEGTCARCGYDLTGLAMVGHCPECGHEYDGHTRAGFASHAALRQARLDRIVARVRTVCLAACGAMALMCAGAVPLAGFGDKTRAFAVGLIVASFFGLAALVSYLYEKPGD